MAVLSTDYGHLFEGESSNMLDLTHEGDGSAKVALIAMDRSIAAWWRIRSQFHGHKGTIAKCLVYLTQLKEATEQTFVNARSFVRPGFDEVEILFP